MNKNTVLVIAITLVGSIFAFFLLRKEDKQPIVITTYASVPYRTIDQLINEAELIIVGNAKETLPSKWKTQSGEIPQDLTKQEIVDANLSIITDTQFIVNNVIKGDYQNKTIRIRSFFGEIDQYRFENTSQPKYEPGKEYLLFLFKDYGPTQVVDPGDYIPLSSSLGVYQIIDGSAFSPDGKWLLEDLIVYIEKTLSGEMPPVDTSTAAP